jgi:hypothetical protein
LTYDLPASDTAPVPRVQNAWDYLVAMGAKPGPFEPYSRRALSGATAFDCGCRFTVDRLKNFKGSLYSRPTYQSNVCARHAKALGAA